MSNSSATLLFVGLLALQTVTGAPICLAQDLTPPDYYFQFREATEASEQGDHGRAKAIWTRLAEQTPDNPMIWYRLAQAHRELGETEQAIRAGERFIQLGFTHMRARATTTKPWTRSTPRSEPDDRIEPPSSTTKPSSHCAPTRDSRRWSECHRAQ